MTVLLTRRSGYAMFAAGGRAASSSLTRPENGAT